MNHLVAILLLPSTDTLSVPYKNTLYPLGLVLICTTVILLLLIFLGRRDLKSKRSLIRIALLAAILIFSAGWFGREYLDYHSQIPSPYPPLNCQFGACNNIKSGQGL